MERKNIESETKWINESTLGKMLLRLQDLPNERDSLKQSVNRILPCYLKLPVLIGVAVAEEYAIIIGESYLSVIDYPEKCRKIVKVFSSMPKFDRAGHCDGGANGKIMLAYCIDGNVRNMDRAMNFQGISIETIVDRHNSDGSTFRCNGPEALRARVYKLTREEK
jgi:hypothetical protein